MIWSSEFSSAKMMFAGVATPYLSLVWNASRSRTISAMFRPFVSG